MGVATMPARLQALGGEPPPQLGDDAVDRREIGQRPRRQRPIELAWRRANAAIAIRARSRIAPSAPSLNAAAIWARRASS